MIKEFRREIMREYDLLRQKNEFEAAQRKEKAYKKIPRLKEIDEEIKTIGFEITRNIIKDPASYEFAVKELSHTMDALKQEKAYIMTENNLPLDYLEVHHKCPHCKDTGYLDNHKECTCLKQKLISRLYAMSNMQKLIDRENFSSFNTEIFDHRERNEEGLTQRENITQILAYVEEYIHEFPKNQLNNILFYGETGQGKTFFCSSLAKALMDKGHTVLYQTAFKLIDILERYHFGKERSHEILAKYDMLLSADLLIIDDLGSETMNSFTNVQIFNIINNRIIEDKHTIISTNLNLMDLRESYSDRVASRIFNEYQAFKFFGPDVRWEK